MSLPFTMLWCAARIVRGNARTEWLAEWNAEMWHARRGGRAEALRFCLGAFADAFWMWRNGPAQLSRGLRPLPPVRCLGALGLLAALCLAMASRLPEVRSLVLPSPYRGGERLVTVSPAGEVGTRFPTLTFRQFRELSERMPKQFEAMTYYRPIRVKLNGREISAAVASENLFEFLGIAVSHGRSGPAVVLSEAVSRRVAGEGRVEVAGRPAEVAGVIPASAWQLPGPFDAWLMNDRMLESLPGGSKGYLLARRVDRQRDWASRIPVEKADGTSGNFACVSLNRCPILAMPGAALMAFLIVRLASRSLRGRENPRKGRCRRRLFLLAKVALLVPICFFGTLVLQSLIALEILPLLVFEYMIAFRWALRDQHVRCPECLNGLAHPTLMGTSSQTFLDWYGTQSVCMKGHGLLNVPEAPTISFEAQCWQRLDRSWAILFS